MKVVKTGSSIVITPTGGAVTDERDVPSWATRMKVTETHVVVSDILATGSPWTCALADFIGDSGPIVTQPLIKAYLRPIIGS